MKRLVLLTATTLALAVGAAATPALGAISQFDYAGHVRGEPSQTMGFNVKRTANHHRKVGGFTVFDIPYTCSDAPSGLASGWTFTKRMRVHSDRTFAARGDWVELALDPVGRVSGKFRKHGVAVGDFKLRGELGGPGTHCHTGSLEWRATKQQPPT